MSCLLVSQIAPLELLESTSSSVFLPNPACATLADLKVQLTTANLMNTTSWDRPHNTPAEEVPVMWTAITYLAVGLTKGILSLIAILVNTACLFMVHCQIIAQRRRCWEMLYKCSPFYFDDIRRHSYFSMKMITNQINCMPLHS